YSSPPYSPAPPPPPSFPTRRSSDLPRDAGAGAPPSSRASDVVGSGAIGDRFLHVGARRRRQRSTTALWSSNFYHVARRRTAVHRSEEHTSELQSRFDLVCRLLLEKK